MHFVDIFFKRVENRFKEKESLVRTILFLMMLSIAQGALAYQDCKRSVSSLFIGKDLIYMQHPDGYGVTRVKLQSVDNDQKTMDRILSVILSARLASRDLIFRYVSSDDGSPVSCTNPVGQSASGAWIVF